MGHIQGFFGQIHHGYTVHSWLVGAHLGLAVVTLLVLIFISAPYGRFARDGWGPVVPGRLGWVVMETPAVVAFLVCFFAGDGWRRPAAVVLAALWLLHYIHRTYIFPFRLRSTRPMPVVVAALAFGYQLLNAPTNAWQVGQLGAYDAAWIGDPRFVLGIALMSCGIIGNIHSDTVLINLRKPGETGYKIPVGGLFRWVTAANYLGELMIWTGWAVATWSWAGLAFAVYTFANLAPRAAESHRWYKDTFAGAYPTDRKRLLPGIW